jgi:hypothetical protein
MWQFIQELFKPKPTAHALLTEIARKIDELSNPSMRDPISKEIQGMLAANEIPLAVDRVRVWSMKNEK